VAALKSEPAVDSLDYPGIGLVHYLTNGDTEVAFGLTKQPGPLGRR